MKAPAAFTKKKEFLYKTYSRIVILYLLAVPLSHRHNNTQKKLLASSTLETPTSVQRSHYFYSKMHQKVNDTQHTFL